MTPNEPPNYKINQLHVVTRQVQELIGSAVALGMVSEFAEAVKTIFAKLETNPYEWGDPEYRLKKKDAIVYHGIHAKLWVRYVVFEVELQVLLLEIKPLPTSPLAS